MKFCLSLTIAGIAAFAFANVGNAQIVTDFSNNANFNGLGAGDTTLLGTDATTGIDLTFELDSITGGTELRTNANGLGDDSNRRFEHNDEIEFHFETTTNGGAQVIFDTFTFKLHDTDGSDIFTLSSDDFKNRGFADESWGAGISFVEADGQFRFVNTTGSQDSSFTLSARVVTASTDSDITFGFEDSAAGNGSAAWESLTVHAVPEPGTIGLLSACVFGFALYRRRRNDEDNEKAA